MNKGWALINLGRDEEGFRCREEALQLRWQLAVNGHDETLPDVARSLYNIGQGYFRAERFPDGKPGRNRSNRSRAAWPLDRHAGLRERSIAMEPKLTIATIEKPEPVNFILGQTHFIKSVEDIHEALVTAVPGIKFGLAFCESSGKCPVRWTGTDPAMIELAKKNALTIGAGHSFILFLAEGYYPVNVLNAVKMVPEVCRIFCATANPTQVIVAETDQGRGIVGVVDGLPPKGVEGEADIAWRKQFLRQIGYKL